jgi:hypothetical protein
MAVALVFAMKLRSSHIHLDEDLEEFMAGVQPPITKDNCSEILRRSERTTSDSMDSLSNDDDDDDENQGDSSDNDEKILATLSNPSDDDDGGDDDDDNDDDDDDDENELDTTTRGKGRQRKKIWRNCFGESRLHLACKEKHGLKKVKQFISEGVGTAAHCLRCSSIDGHVYFSRMTLIFKIITDGHRCTKPPITDMSILFVICSIRKQILMLKLTMALRH